MTVDAGTLEYKVAADVSGLQAAEAAVDKSTKGMESDFKKTDGAVSKLDTSMKKLPSSVKKANAALGGVSRGAGQAAIQVQQFAGQVQGGTNAVIAFSQQAADIGIVLGAPMIGAILGIAGAFYTALVPSLEDTEESFSDLNEETLQFLGSARELEKLKGAAVLAELEKQAADLAVKIEMADHAYGGMLRRGEDKTEIVAFTKAEKDLDAMNDQFFTTTRQIELVKAKLIELEKEDPKKSRDERIAQVRAEREELKRLTAELRAFASAQGGIQGPVKGQAGKDATTRANLLGDADPAMAVKEQEFAKLEALRSARETELITEQEFDAARIELAQKTADKLNAVKTAAIDKDTETIKGGLAVVGALAEAGLVDAKHAAIAQAAFSLATNIAKASEIGFPANLPFIAGAISQGAQIKSIISGASGKALGGGVDGSSAYRVGEQGPEMLQSNGMNYLLPGQNGTVVSNKDAFGGNGQGAGVTVNIINQSSAVNVSQRKGADSLTYEVLIQDIDSGNGPLSKSLARSTNIGRRTS